MSITYMFKKAIREDGKFFHPLPCPPPLTKCSIGLVKLPGALQNTYNYKTVILLSFSICITGTWLSNTETETVYQSVKEIKHKIVTIYRMQSMRYNQHFNISKCVSLEYKPYSSNSELCSEWILTKNPCWGGVCGGSGGWSQTIKRGKIQNNNHLHNVE